MLNEAVNQAKMEVLPKKEPAKKRSKEQQPLPCRPNSKLSWHEERELRLFKQAYRDRAAKELSRELMAQFQASLGEINLHKYVKSFVRSKLPTLGNGRIVPKAMARFVKHKRYFSRFTCDSNKV